MMFLVGLNKTWTTPNGFTLQKSSKNQWKATSTKVKVKNLAGMILVKVTRELNMQGYFFGIKN